LIHKTPRTACLWAVFLWLFFTFPMLALAGDGFDVQRPPRGMTMPAVIGADLSGRVWKSSELAGKAVLLNFWASWCEPCRTEMPSLQALQARHGDTVVVLAVNYKESPEVVQRFVQRQGWTLPMLTDPQGAWAKRWGIGIFPTSVLLNGQGKAVAVVRGEVDWLAQTGAPWMHDWLRSGKTSP
jgi:thiol-disulfide isomerase/thioredoxin